MFINRSIFFLFPVLLSAVFAFNSCEKVDTFAHTQPYDIPEKSFFANVDGIEFVDTILWGSENGGNELTITATVDGDYPQMIFKIPADITPGTYDLGGLLSTHKAILKFGILPNEQFSALTGSGTLIITKHDTEADYLIGSFDYIAVASAGNTSLAEFDVTDGEFTISY